MTPMLVLYQQTSILCLSSQHNYVCYREKILQATTEHSRCTLITWPPECVHAHIYTDMGSIKALISWKKYVLFTYKSGRFDISDESYTAKDPCDEAEDAHRKQ
ncbi:hypothetical protein GOP47_0024270 [Adiantum capillus-veneris]|uniref:Uncharacterized protein n=1 Tax=Adiantum capillus-veneris TaxID=13818 RepID=A0A9D4Z5E1_ADICA|nr:hypothetical protein GOP47_0024270 [Adiantum capillus-veneris]